MGECGYIWRSEVRTPGIELRLVGLCTRASLVHLTHLKGVSIYFLWWDIPSEVKTPLHSRCRGVPLEWESYDLPEGRGAKEEQERVCMPAILWVSHILGLCVWFCHITLQGS